MDGSIKSQTSFGKKFGDRYLRALKTCICFDVKLIFIDLLQERYSQYGKKPSCIKTVILSDNIEKLERI